MFGVMDHTGHRGPGIANPWSNWSGAMMLNHLGEPAAGAAIVDAVETVLEDGAAGPGYGGRPLQGGASG